MIITWITWTLITIYVYLNNVTEKMSPLHVIKKSHEYSYTLFQNSDNKKRYDKEILIGNAGSVFVWSCVTMHRTRPFKS